MTGITKLHTNHTILTFVHTNFFRISQLTYDLYSTTPICLHLIYALGDTKSLTGHTLLIHLYLIQHTHALWVIIVTFYSQHQTSSLNLTTSYTSHFLSCYSPNILFSSLYIPPYTTM